MKALLIAVALGVGMSAAALAATETPATTASGASCFSSSQWNGWKARDDHTMYLRVRTNDVYQVDFKSGCSEARRIGVHLVTVFRGSTNICHPIDLDIKVADNSGSFSTSCIATGLKKLSPAEAKAIPKEFQP